MAYVIRYCHDIYLSYSHKDDPTWIRGFERALLQELQQKLGQEPAIWQDEQKLRLGVDWPEAMADAIRGSAVFLTILSPGYRISEWCGRERKCFTDQFPNLGDMKVQLKAGRAYRFLKIVKTPWEDDGHLEFFAEAQHLDFFYRDAAGFDYDLVPGTDPFRTRIEEAAHYIAALLKAMRRTGEAVFVASPGPDMIKASEDLRNELGAQGYVVRPEGPMDRFFSDKAVKKEMDSALLSVHLLGSQHDEFAERQVRLAGDAGKRLLFWIPKSALESAEPRQRKLLEALRNAEGIPGLFALLEDPAVRNMIAEVMRALKPSSVHRDEKDGRAPSIYLVCDVSEREDYAYAEQLRESIGKREKFMVMLPEANPPRGKSVEAAHRDLLMACDGVLLYRNAAPLSWLMQQAPAVQWAEQMLKRPPFRSKAYLVNDPSTLPAVFSNVITRPQQFDPLVLEPFLAPLRRAVDAHANS